MENTLIELIRNYAIKNNKSLTQFCNEANIGTTTLFNIAHNNNKLSTKTYYKLGDYMNIDPVELSKLKLN